MSQPKILRTSKFPSSIKLNIPSSPSHITPFIPSSQRHGSSKVFPSSTKNTENLTFNFKDSLFLSSRNTLSPAKSTTRRSKLSIDLENIALESRKWNKKLSISTPKHNQASTRSGSMTSVVPKFIVKTVQSPKSQTMLNVEKETKKNPIKSMNELTIQRNRTRSKTTLEGSPFKIEKDDVFVDLFEVHEDQNERGKVNLETSIITTEPNLSERGISIGKSDVGTAEDDNEGSDIGVIDEKNKQIIKEDGIKQRKHRPKFQETVSKVLNDIDQKNLNKEIILSNLTSMNKI